VGAMKRFALCALMVAACGGSDNKAADAPAQHDSASSATVQMVTCPATPAAVVMTSGFAYSPMMTTITQGQIVQFVMPSIHNVVSGHTPADSAIADPGLSVQFNETKCFMFTQTGTYGFHCGPHSFNGTIMVN
jgi:plastocyanin